MSYSSGFRWNPTAKRFMVLFGWKSCLWWHKINNQPRICVTTGIPKWHCTQISNSSMRIADNVVYLNRTPSWSNLGETGKQNTPKHRRLRWLTLLQWTLQDDGDQRTPEKEIRRMKCGLYISGGVGSTKGNWMATSGLWPKLHWTDKE